MRKSTLVLVAAGAAAIAAAAIASGTTESHLIHFENMPAGDVSSVVMASDGTLVPIAAFDAVGPGQAYLASTVGGRSIGVRGSGECDRVHLRLGAACPAGVVRLLSLRVVGTTAPAKVLLFDRGGNVGPGEMGLMVPATGPGGSQVITFPTGSTGLLDDAVAELVVMFPNGEGFVDDVLFECPSGGGTEEPAISLVKTATPNPVAAGAPVTYGYVVTNTGNVPLENVVVVDDNGTPGNTADDFTAGTVALLLPGASSTFSQTLIPEASPTGDMCMTVNGVDTVVGSLATTVLPNGNVEVKYTQSRNVVDNTYGTGTSSNWGTRGHSFRDLLGSDKAQFRFRNGAGNVVLEFYADYISASSAAPSGYATLGALGGDGGMVSGSAANIVSVRTSLADCLNQSPAFYGFTTNSPAGSSYPGWAYDNSYTVTIAAAAFGASGFGSVEIPGVHNSPSMLGFNLIEPRPCGGEVTNIATVTATAGSTTVTATDSATVVIGDGSGGSSDGGKKPKPPKEPKDPKDPKEPKEPKDSKDPKSKRRGRGSHR